MKIECDVNVWVFLRGSCLVPSLLQLFKINIKTASCEFMDYVVFFMTADKV